MQPTKYSLKLSIATLVFAWDWSNAMNDDCQTPAGHHGRCLPVKNCKYILDILHKPGFSAQDQQYLDQFRCGKLSGSRKVLTCCPEFQSVDGCGRLTLRDNIIGGQETEPDEFPWTALLVYAMGVRVFYRCGGALIGDRYVLTAAHCVDSLGRMKLVAVRLGEWDLSTVYDCKDEEFGRSRCNKFPHRDFDIEKVFVHEGYSSTRLNKEHDIALLKLAKSAPSTDSISPICLPTVEMDSRMEPEKSLFDVAGWGATEAGVPRSDRKRKVTLPGQNLSECQLAYEAAAVSFTENQLCVGGTVGKDSCRGDSGGPLMVIIDNRWHLAGIVSLGAVKCGMKGVPGIYTRLGSYLPWVAAKIEGADRFQVMGSH
ncbi:CLIP domain-containing serine protease B4-like isoform X2 [Malaya genurostris]|uniref:CLIP domain-containing serine protease B4-like isoform X2 n=1 Tax=Malaya genurostris TaxID=325434 RepID=UPI0026F3DDD0|nr:CLIP domain-containing serine protease B4-like isoform X2 [Malaya genurostris]